MMFRTHLKLLETFTKPSEIPEYADGSNRIDIMMNDQFLIIKDKAQKYVLLKILRTVISY